MVQGILWDLIIFSCAFVNISCDFVSNVLKQKHTKKYEDTLKI